MVSTRWNCAFLKFACSEEANFYDLFQLKLWWFTPVLRPGAWSFLQELSARISFCSKIWTRSLTFADALALCLLSLLRHLAFPRSPWLWDHASQGPFGTTHLYAPPGKYPTSREISVQQLCRRCKDKSCLSSAGSVRLLPLIQSCVGPSKVSRTRHETCRQRHWWFFKFFSWVGLPLASFATPLQAKPLIRKPNSFLAICCFKHVIF